MQPAPLRPLASDFRLKRNSVQSRLKSIIKRIKERRGFFLVLSYAVRLFRCCRDIDCNSRGGLGPTYICGTPLNCI